MAQSSSWAVAYGYRGKRHCVSTRSRSRAVADRFLKAILTDIWRAGEPWTKHAELLPAGASETLAE